MICAMPHFIVEGADRETGREVTTTVEALSRAAAEREVSAQGVLVSHVEQSTLDHGPASVIPVMSDRRQLAALERIDGNMRAIRGWVTFAGVMLAMILVAELLARLVAVAASMRH